MSDPNRTIPVQVDEFRRMERQLAEHAHRAALVAEWAEGLRAGKRYATTTEDGVKWEAGVNRFLDGERFYVSAPLSYPSYCWVMSTHLAAQFMLVISDQWAEAG